MGQTIDAHPKIEDDASLEFLKMGFLGVLKVDFLGKTGVAGAKTPSGH
jgi:hypothetical protein